MSGNHERAAKAHNVFLPLLHPSMLEDISASSAGALRPLSKVCQCFLLSPAGVPLQERLYKGALCGYCGMHTLLVCAAWQRK